MENADLKEAVSALGREVVLIESRAHEVSAQFQTLRTQTEVLKMDILRRGLAKRTKSLSRQAGFKSMGRDGKNLGVGLVAAAAGLVFGGVLTRDGLSAVVAGISGFDGFPLTYLVVSVWHHQYQNDELFRAALLSVSQPRSRHHPYVRTRWAAGIWLSYPAPLGRSDCLALSRAPPRRGRTESDRA